MRIRTQILAMLFPLAAFAAEAPPVATPTPAEQKIAWAMKSIEKEPQKYPPYNDLALALAQRARETSDPAFYGRAEEALQKSFSLAPSNYDGEKVRVWILLGRHEFQKALGAARALNQRMPDDVISYGLLADANVELGNYEEAEMNAQWMLDIRPGNVPGLTRAAFLRELFGDVDGALELMNEAFDATSPEEVEDRAWTLTQMAHLYVSAGKLESAEKLAGQALGLFPGYHYALAQMAKVRAAQGKHAAAVELLRRRYEAAPHPENLFDLASALEQAGRHEAARKAFAEFENMARSEMERADNANRELIFYYADHAPRPAEALRVARLEMARRQDVFTRDAYAWALHANGENSEARREIEKALAVGIRDARFLYHAAVIASESHDGDAAVNYLKQSLEANPAAETAPAARDALARLDAARPRVTAGR